MTPTSSPLSPTRTPPVCRRSRSRRSRASCCTCSCASRARAAFSRSARSARTRRSGWPAAFRTTATVVTIEAEPANAAIARANLDRAGVGQKVDIRIGRGDEVLPTLQDEPRFDFVFIDADKESNTIYLDWAARLGHPGTVVVVDNIGRGGEVANPATTASHVIGTQRGLEMLGRDPRFDATALQTLDLKGWDGVAIAVVTDAAASDAAR